MKKKLVLFVIFASILIAFGGCSQRIGDFTLLSTKNVEIGGKYKKLDKRFQGEDTKMMLLGIPLGTPNLKTAVDNCIENGKGYLITDAVVDYSFFTVILAGQMKYTVTGDVWVKADMSSLTNPNTELFQLQSGDSGYTLVSLNNPSNIVKVNYLAYSIK